MYYYIVNPAAGGGRINKIQSKLKILLKRRRIDGDFVKTTGKGDALKIAQKALKEGFTTIVAVGGDGTVSEVVNGIIDSSKAVLGILPIGSTNILANALGIYDCFEGVDILAQRRVKTIDLGKVNDTFFITSLEIGLETEIQNERYNNSFFKKLLFRKKILDKILTFKPFTAEIKFDNQFSVNSNIFNLSIFNAKPSEDKREKSLNDGELLAVLVSYQSKLNLLKNFSNIISGAYEELPFISKFKAKKIFIDTGKFPQKVFADAEYIGTTPVEVLISTKKLKVIVSKKRNFD